MLDVKTYDIETELDVAKVILETAKFAKKIGFPANIRNKIATTVSELGTNVLHHAVKGSVTIACITQADRKGIEIVVKDQGPGIEDIDKAFTEHFSTNSSLGLGLPAVKRMMDELNIKTKKNQGTSITVRKWLNHGKY